MTVVGTRAGARHELGEDRRQRRRARSHNLPVNGRQMSQLMLQAPGSQNAGTGTWQDIRFCGRAVEQNAIRYDGIEGSAIIDAAPGQSERRNRDAVQAAGEPRERPGVPRRVEQLPGRIRHRHRRPGQRRSPSPAATTSTAPCSSTCGDDALDAPNYFDTRRPGLPKSPLKQNQFGGSFGGPIVEEQGVLLRQLRGLPPERRHQHRRGHAERRGLGPRRAGDRRAAARLPGARRGHPSRRSRRTRTSTSRNCRRRRTSRENAASGRFDFKLSNNWSSYVRVFHDQGTSDAARQRVGPRRAHRSEPEQRGLQPAGRPVAIGRRTSSSSATTPRRPGSPAWCRSSTASTSARRSST